MKIIRSIYAAIAAIILMAAIPCPGQEVRITGLDTSSGRLDFTLSPAETVSDYSCSAEWRSALTAGNWTNSWYQPFVPFPQSNGLFYAAVPRFFRISCTAGQAANSPPVNYTVTGVIPSQIVNGMICWPNTGSTDLTYYVEQATGTNGPWLSQWTGQTNIHTTVTGTNFQYPAFFRVVTIAEGGELPW
jgi:hypothetical protein